MVQAWAICCVLSNVMNKLQDFADQVVRSPSGQHGQQSIC